jgi:hypothetical protein
MGDEWRFFSGNRFFKIFWATESGFFLPLSFPERYHAGNFTAPYTEQVENISFCGHDTGQALHFINPALQTKK